jgi:hypothetical protein
MEVESFEIAGLSGQDFVIFGKEQEPKFEARLLLGSKIDERLVASRIVRALGGRWLARISRVRGDWIDINVNRIGG